MILSEDLLTDKLDFYLESTMMKLLTRPMMALCLFGLLLAPAAAQDASLKVGDKAPDFEVDTLSGEKFKLSDQYGADKKPTILLFSRANW